LTGISGTAPGNSSFILAPWSQSPNAAVNRRTQNTIF
jgi:hypothetical protein